LKVAIIGSRNCPMNDEIFTKISENVPRNCTEVVSGGALGIDTLAERFAKENSIRKKIFLPDYARFGKSAPLIDIIEYSDYVLAFWNGNSRGTAFVIAKCVELEKNVKIIRF